MNNEIQIAKEILSQLGGNKFIAMTGSKNFAAIENGLTMKLAKNHSGGNYLRIKLDAMDTYTMEFIKVVKSSLNVVKEYEGVYCDMLATIFEKETGLYTHF